MQHNHACVRVQALGAPLGAASARGDYRYLIQPRGNGTTWYAVAEVPRTLRAVLGKKRLVRSLKTEDVRVARIARWAALEEIKKEIANAGGHETREHQGLAAEALAYREELAKASAQRRDDIMYAIVERAEQIDRQEGVPSSQAEEEAEEGTSSRGAEFAKIASGRATPVDFYVERWLAASGYSERTKADARTALAQFKAWCSDTGGTSTTFIETVTDRIASDFRDEAFVSAGMHAHTANKKLSALRQYWQWLNKSFSIRPNPWAGKSLAKPRAHRIAQDGPQGSERPFTDDEVLTLLNSDADDDLKDFMRIAALSAMRLEEIGQLRVRDCMDGMFSVTRGKTPAAIRTIPIHSALKKLVKGRIGKRDPNEYLFADLQDTGWDNNRTMALSKRFGYLRKRIGVDDKREGARRSKVNFHSFRRWFATKAEEAGQRENVVAAVMGHSKNVGLTFGHYSKAQLTELKRECVEAVKLPRARAGKANGAP
ncbi:tyrosine-type recombinase/integrase [Bradyrhizobium australiense]|uniref:Tyrosine-type recombinase/integrase n=1 Tax=Bradyrhizobium australiense TaxID=2721161 RepID=A0A7Y4GS06_9BRAD|nr:tyrosine-type recombinase/integrase [Bradyrhizobium australiense]NOJ40923.1 tyrosine-type recombinase/integrase [Bradyrhizobium australiense]